jgi:O-antigen ligase
MKYAKLTFNNFDFLKIISYLLVMSIGLVTLVLVFSTDFILIFMGLFIGIILSIGIMRNPIFGIALIILFTYTGASRLILPKIFFGTTLLTIFAFLLINLSHYKLFIVKVPQYLLIFGFLIVVCLSMIFALFPEETISPFFELIKNLIFFFIFINIVKNRENLEFLIWILMISGVIACIIGIYIIFSTGLGELFLISSRFGSVLGNPNWFAGTIVPLIPISFFFSKTQKNIWVKIFIMLSILIYIISIAFSLSRSALLTTSIILIYIMFYEIKQRKILIITPIIFLLMIVVVFPQIFDRIIERFDLIFSGKDVSVNIRLWVLDAGINMFLDHPILGVGIGNFERLSGQYVTLIENKVAHNMYLDIAAETGIFGLIMFTSIFWNSILNIRKHFSRADTNFAYIARGIYWGLLGYLITGLFVSVHFYFFLWLILAFTVSTAYIGEKHLDTKTNDIYKKIR